MDRLRNWDALIGLILIVSFGLNLYGFRWGTPSRWCIDQDVGSALRMMGAHTLIPVDYYHAPFYKYVLMVALGGYLCWLKISGVSLDAIAQAAKVSWATLATEAPDVATNFILVGRLISAIAGVLAVYVVYLLAKRGFGVRAGVLAAMALAFSQGFVTDNHIERSSPLFNCLAILTLYTCVRALDASRPRRLLTLTGLCAGLAVATKYHGVLLLIPALITTLFVWRGTKSEPTRDWRQEGQKLAGLLACTGLGVGGGVLLGWPTLAFSLPQLLTAKQSYTVFLYGGEGPAFPIGLLNYAIEVVLLMGVPLAAFALSGILSQVRSVAEVRRRQIALILLAFVAVNFAFAASIRMTDAYPKFILAVLPALAVFAGLGMEGLLACGRIPSWAKGATVAACLVYSMLFAASASLVYARDDTRYASVSWVEEHVPQGSTIEVLDEIDWVGSILWLRDFNIVYLGRESRSFAGSLFRISDSLILTDHVGIVDGYCDQRVRSGLESEYVVIHLDSWGDPPEEPIPSGMPACMSLKRRLLEGRTPYRLVAAFRPPNYKLHSRVIPGLSYPRHWLWYPVSNSYTSPAIAVFQAPATLAG